MSERRRLATYVQISDLHVGDVNPDTGEVLHPSWAPEAWTSFPAFTGIVGHDKAVVNHLVQCWDDLRQRENAQLIVTGDLTAYGSSEQFAAAVELLEQRSPRWGLATLAEPAWRGRGISGNHDHWGGTFLGWGNPVSGYLRQVLDKLSARRHWEWVRDAASLLSVPVLELLRQSMNRPAAPVARWLKSFPFVGDAEAIAGTPARLRWLAIDTDAEVSAASLNRYCARGSFHKQLEFLRRKLAAPAPDEIRVLLLHHSPVHAEHILGIEARSRHELQKLIAELDIRVLLTGHIHRLKLDTDTVTDRSVAPPREKRFLEARCGTSTQVPRVPLTRPDALGQWQRQLDLNTLLVHRLFLDDTDVIWETQVYQHIMSQGFVETKHTTSLPVLRPGLAFP